jgi:hypothetical protein
MTATWGWLASSNCRTKKRAPALVNSVHPFWV